MKRFIRKIMPMMLAVMMVAAYVPVTAAGVFAAEGDFDQTQQIENLTLDGAGYASIRIVWDKQDGARGYQVYRATSATGKYKKLVNTANTTYTNKSLTMGKTYYYKVRAYNKVKSKTYYGQFSEVLVASPVLKAPEITLTCKKESISVAWNKVSGTTKYILYVADSDEGEYTKLTTTKSTSYAFKDVTKGKMYYFKVRGYRTVSKKNYYSEYSDVAQGRTRPQKPSDLQVEATGSSTISLEWTASPDCEYYEVWKSQEPKDGYEIAGTSAETSFEDIGLDPQSTWYYKVRACADVNEQQLASDFIGGSYRENVLAQAISWEGLKESNKSNKPIIDVYNNWYYNKYKKKTGFTYTTPWCAIFVSAVAIKTDTTDIIPISASCPAMLNAFKDKGQRVDGKGYSPKPADVVFYDWIGDNGKRNGVPDHVGYVVSCKGDSITAIEGNKTISYKSGKKTKQTDAVAYRTFSSNYADLLAYGLPEYAESKATTSEMAPELQKAMCTENPVTEEEVEEAVEVINEQAEGAMNSEEEKAREITEYIQEEKPAEGCECQENTYNAYMMTELCNEMGLSASTVINVEKNGNEISWSEVTIDGNTYLINPSDNGFEPVLIVPERIN